MADTLFFKRSQSMYPYWVNMPPTVPQYPAPQNMFRREEPDKYTRRTGLTGHQNWTDKWYHWENSRRRDELPGITDSRHRPYRPWQFEMRMGLGKTPKWTREGKDWPVDDNKFLRAGLPNTENHVARAKRELSFKDDNLYPFSNYMTSSYRQPVFSVHGPTQKDPVFGLTMQKNRHGHMPFVDYY
ncbi:unnamed protein product [Candidula unifasciata]|uniref:Uncharacterized protein n=1 Tax=Candidula unifasciata TaxID=100452 RepID=A0A8S4A3C2_9EUPU|nr:unnamed protein product [Candidula unifasciata]